MVYLNRFRVVVLGDQLIQKRVPFRYKHKWEEETSNAQLAATECRRLEDVNGQLEDELHDAQTQGGTTAHEAHRTKMALEATRTELKTMSNDLARQCEAALALETVNQELVSRTPRS
jgi:hypothetical protein